MSTTDYRQIQLINGKLHVVSLNAAEYDGFEFTNPLAWEAQRELPADYSFDDCLAEQRATEDRLLEALSSYWTPSEDFWVAWENYDGFRLTGAIYMPHVMCRDYLQIVHGILQETRMRHKWAYHTSVELEVALDGRCFFRFILQNGIAYVEDTLGSFDFVRYFSRSKEDGRIENDPDLVGARTREQRREKTAPFEGLVLERLGQMGYHGSELLDIVRTHFPLPDDVVAVLLDAVRRCGGRPEASRFLEIILGALRAASHPFDGRPLVECYERNHDPRIRAGICQLITARKLPHGIDDWIEKVLAEENKRKQ